MNATSVISRRSQLSRPRSLALLHILHNALCCQPRGSRNTKSTPMEHMRTQHLLRLDQLDQLGFFQGRLGRRLRTMARNGIRDTTRVRRNTGMGNCAMACPFLDIMGGPLLPRPFL